MTRIFANAARLQSHADYLLSEARIADAAAAARDLRAYRHECIAEAEAAWDAYRTAQSRANRAAATAAIIRRANAAA